MAGPPPDSYSDDETKTTTKQDSRPSILGQSVLGPNGQFYTVKKATTQTSGPTISTGFGSINLPSFGFTYSLVGPDGTEIPLTPGDYVTATGKHVYVDDKGKVLDSRSLTETERQTLGLGFYPDEEAGGSGGTVTGSRAPDPIGAANGLLQEYLARVEVGDMPRQAALQEFQAQLNALNAQLDNEQIAGQFAQNAAVYTNQAQSDFDTNMLRQQEGQVDRDVAVAQEFGNRAQSMVRDFLPSFVPGLTGVSLPGVGGGPIPVPQVNPDQIYGLAGLNQVRDITHTPTAPVPIPTPNITPFDPGALPQIPQYTPPPIPPEIAGLFMAGAQGFPGFIV